jgi:Uncharacterised protein conserved in bacteria (DUF2336)
MFIIAATLIMRLGMSSVAFHDREETLRKSDHQKGQDPLRAVTELFLSAAPQLDDDGVAIVDTVFDFALPKPNAATLTDISVRMAPVPNAPSRLMRRLASDAEISVAGPVLSQSPRLSEADLCDVAAVMGNPHLLAISARKHLTSPVTDILIVRGDNEVARAVASNKTAQLSDHGVARLLERAESDDTISASLYARTDLPADVNRSGLANTKSHVEDAKAKIAAAKRFAALLQQAGDLTEFKIGVLARERRYEEMLASISLLSHLKYQLIERMMRGSDLRGLTLVCKSLGFNMTTMNAIWNLAVSCNGTSLDKIRSARRDFLTVSEEIANAVQAAMSSLHSLPAE